VADKRPDEDELDRPVAEHLIRQAEIAARCMFETTRLQGDARYLAHNTEVPLHLFRGNPQNPTMAIVVPKALGGPHRRNS
jgi:hypothetical protein